MIVTSRLTKLFGSTTALADVDLEVKQGSVYGLVGPNGAGKTTLLGLLAGLIRPTSGSVNIAVDRSQIAVLPDTPQFDPWLTGREVVALAQHLSAEASAVDDADGVLRQVALDHAADRPVGGYSRGMLQRLGVAATVVGSPRLLLLDEPASALDPLGRREVLDLVTRLRGSATVLFSSHILADVQEVCDTVGVLDGGRLLFQGPIDHLLVGSAVPAYLVRCRPPTKPVAELLKNEVWVTDVVEAVPDELRISVRSVEEAQLHLPGALARAGARVVSIQPEAVSLEKAFLELTV